MKVRQSSINGYSLLVRPDEDVGREIVLFREFEPLETEYLKQTIRPADVCVDVGANVGYFTCLMAHCATSGHVHAFEPVPLNFHLLSSSLELNGFNNVTVNRCALGADETTATFSVAADTGYSSFVRTGRRPEAHTIPVRVTTLDSYIAQHDVPRVDIVKVDVEGAEETVLRGAEGLLSHSDHRPRLLMLELFEPMLERYESTIEGVVARLRMFDYTPYVLDGHRLQPLERRHFNTHYNVLFLNNGSQNNDDG